MNRLVVVVSLAAGLLAGGAELGGTHPVVLPGAVLPGAPAPAAAAQITEPDPRPNIVLILMDEIGRA